jgi:hypothetical protein
MSYSEIHAEIKESFCRSCGGSGEVTALCSPSDPEDGSYDLVACGVCRGTGFIENSSKAIKRHSVVFRRQRDTPAFKAAVEAMEKQFDKKTRTS